MDRRKFVNDEIEKSKKECGQECKVCYSLPVGFESAYGMFDVTKNTLFLNDSIDRSDVRFLWTFFHEYRHFLQYNCPNLFDKSIIESLNYVIHFDGNCYKLVENEWKNCCLKDENLDFVEIYKNLPYEIDANNFAYKKVKAVVNENQFLELEKIFSQSKPTKNIENQVYKKLFKTIDELIKK